MIRILDVITISPSTLPNGQVGMPYAQTLTASGGTAPYTWTLVSGALPTGLSLGSLTGIISGIPSAAGDFNFRVRATDVLTAFGEKDYD